MPPKRRKFQRPLGERRYRKLFVIAVEGVKTEPQYFALFNDQQSVIRVNCLKGSQDSSPPQVLKRMEDHLRQEELDLKFLVKVSCREPHKRGGEGVFKKILGQRGPAL
jgi:hypothetical protein